MTTNKEDYLTTEDFARFLQENSDDITRLNESLEEHNGTAVETALLEEIAQRVKWVRNSCTSTSSVLAHKLLSQGLSERRVAFLLGVSTTTVRKWRD